MSRALKTGLSDPFAGRGAVDPQRVERGLEPALQATLPKVGKLAAQYLLDRAKLLPKVEPISAFVADLREMVARTGNPEVVGYKLALFQQRLHRAASFLPPEVLLETERLLRGFLGSKEFQAVHPFVNRSSIPFVSIGAVNLAYRTKNFSACPEIRALLTVLHEDDSLRHVLKHFVGFKDEFLDSDPVGSSLRVHTPLLVALMHYPSTALPLEYAIQARALAQTRHNLGQIARGNCYVRTSIISGGPAGANLGCRWSELSGGTQEFALLYSGRHLGGNFGVSGALEDVQAGYSLNNRRRAVNIEEPFLPGTANSLFPLVGGPVNEADVGFKTYATANEVRTTVSVNLHVACARNLMPDCDILAVRRNTSDRPGAYSQILAAGSATGGDQSIYRVTSDRVCFASGIGEPNIACDVRDPFTAKWIDNQLRLPLEQRQYMRFPEYVQFVYGSNRPAALAKCSKMLVAGDGDSAFVAMGIALGTEGNVQMTKRSLMKLDTIYHVGAKRLTKEAALEGDRDKRIPPLRARYHLVGLHYPRDFDPAYHYVIEPDRGKVTTLSPGPDGGITVNLADGIRNSYTLPRDGIFVDTSGIKGDDPLALKFLDGEEIVRPAQIRSRLKEIATTQGALLFYEGKDGPVSALQIERVWPCSDNSVVVGYRVFLKDGKVETGGFTISSSTKKLPTAVAKILAPDSVTSVLLPAAGLATEVAELSVNGVPPLPIGRKIVGEEVYLIGVADRLPPTREEKTDFARQDPDAGRILERLLDDITQNSVAAFTREPRTERAALFFAGSDAQRDPLPSFIGTPLQRDPLLLPDIKPKELVTQLFRFDPTDVAESVQVSREISRQTLLKVAFAAAWQGVTFSEKLASGKIEFRFDRDPDNPSGVLGRIKLEAQTLQKNAGSGSRPKPFISKGIPTSAEYTRLISDLQNSPLLALALQDMMADGSQHPPTIDVVVPIRSRKISASGMTVSVTRNPAVW